MNDEKMLLYIKATERLKRIGITDPTSVIAELESEISQYRTTITRMESQNRRDNLQEAIGKINFNTSEITKEDQEYIYATSLYGTHKYSKLQLAIFWLTHDNDCFYETFGFSWVPDNKLQDAARKEINKHSNITIGVDISMGESESINHIIPIPEEIFKDILTSIEPIGITKHSHTFSSFHNK